MSSNVTELYQSLVGGLDLPPTPTDPTIERVWQAYTEVLNLVGVRLLEEQFGAFTGAADEVRLQLERHERVAKLMEGMTLKVPQVTSRAVSTLGHYLEETRDVEDFTKFLSLNSGIADRFSMYAKTHLGRAALPVMRSLSVLTKSAALMNECVSHELAPLTRRDW